MNDNGLYLLPELPYKSTNLEPVISQRQLEIHHSKHHKAYVDKANELLEKLGKNRSERQQSGYADITNKLTFNTGGHTLHTLFWQNLEKPSQENRPKGTIAEKINEEFGSFEQFKKEFSDVASSIEGAGWAGLVYCQHTGRIIIEQIGNHNLRLIPNHQLIMVLDMWEHAYYLDYQNDKKTYIENVWQIYNWEEINKRLEQIFDK